MALKGATVIQEALAATAWDRLGAFLFVASVAVAAVLIKLDADQERRQTAAELEQEPELVSAWDGFPPSWQPPEAETDLEKTRLDQDLPGRRAA